MAKDFVRYDNEQDVHMRLASSYLRYRGKTYFCDHAGGMNVTLYSIDKDRMLLELQVSANDPELDISSVPLGYCNLESGPVYLSREAARRQKQGVSLNNIAGYIEKERQWCQPLAKYGRVTHRDVHNTIMGLYPTLDEIFKTGKSAAFNRRLCLILLDDKRWKIKYMTNFVGILDQERMKARLVNRHAGNSFLRNALEMRGIDING